MAPQEHHNNSHEDPTKDNLPNNWPHPLLCNLHHIFAWSVTQYLIKTVSILGIWKMNCLIPPTDAELMGGCRHKKERYYPTYLEAYHKKNLILTHYMLIAWWLNILDWQGHYTIHPGSMEQLLLMTKNLTTLGYTYAAPMIKKPPEILGIVQILTHPPDTRGRHRTPRHNMAFSGTNTQNYQSNLTPQQYIHSGTQGALTPSTLTLTSAQSTTP